MRSMTGFGRAAVSRDGWEVAVQASSVNRKALEVVFSLPREWQLYESELAGIVRERFARGRIQVAIDVRSTLGHVVEWNDAAVDAVLDRLAAVAGRRGIQFTVTPELIFQVAAASAVENTALDHDAAIALIREALLPALEELVATRSREGENLARDLGKRVELMKAIVEAIAARGGTTVQDYREGLLQRLRQLGLEIDLDDERVLKEIALFAERIDVTEEITRLGSHLDHLVSLIDATEAVGRKAEFVLQEIGREIHTIGSKANDLEIARHVIEFKNELERVREQVQNVE